MFEDFIGQEKVKEVLKTLINAAKIRNKACDHFFLGGPAGFGKSKCCKIIAKELGKNLFSINCATLRDIKDIRNIINQINFMDIMFLDEIHSMPKKCSEFMYTVMEDFCYYDTKGRVVNLPEFTIAAASTHAGKISGPMKSRFKFNAEFVEYTEEELTKVCHLTCQEQGFKLDEDLAMLIARTCRGVPRLVKARTEWLYNWMISNNLTKISSGEVLKIIALQGYNKDGLENRDIQYLRELKCGTIGINQLSSLLNIDQSTIMNDIEPFLIKSRFVEISGSGRSLTRNGFDYIKELDSSTA